MLCPDCHAKLKLDPAPVGALWACARCGGMAVNLAVLRKYLQKDIVKTFWRRMHTGQPCQRSCPSCRQALRTFSVTVEDLPIHLDLCKVCQLIWFDKGEFGILPPALQVLPEDALSPAAKEKLALLKIQYAHDQQAGMEKDANWLQMAYMVVSLLIRVALRL